MQIMNPEERFERIERQLEFMAGILAQLVDTKQQHDAEIARHTQLIGENSRQIAQLAEVVSTLARVVGEQGDRMEERFRRTDERLNALITVVERHSSSGHN